MEFRFTLNPFVSVFASRRANSRRSISRATTTGQRKEYRQTARAGTAIYRNRFIYSLIHVNICVYIYMYTQYIYIYIYIRVLIYIYIYSIIIIIFFIFFMYVLCIRMYIYIYMFI